MMLSTFLMLLGVAGFARGSDAAKAMNRTEVVIEKQQGDRGVAMSPQHVFTSGDMIRIRFRTNSDGYLYVVNRDAQNKLTVLFPRDETGRDNKIQAGTDYFIPSTTDGWFRIQGEPGYDTAYFVLSQTDLRKGGKAAPPEAPATTQDTTPIHSDTMKPRCDDTLFRARGECLDSNSGPRNLPLTDKVPAELAAPSKLQPRDLTFIREEQSTVILSKPLKDTYVVYEFKIAHQ